MNLRKNNSYQFSYLFPLLLFLAGCNSSQTPDEKNAADTSQTILQKQDTAIAAAPTSDSPAVSSMPAEKKNDPVTVPSVSKENLSYTIIQSNDNTFGYDIYKNGKLIIHQPSIPAISGNKGFETKALAESVAHVVIDKVSKGEMPPTVSIEELKSLGVNVSK